MNRTPYLVALLAALLILGLSGVALAAWTHVPVVRLTAETDIAAPPAAIWTFLTSGKNIVTWCPIWKNPANAKIRIAKVGDVLDFTDEWGNGGRSVVTYLAPNQELRVAHEPNNGSYMCQAKLRLEARGAMTHLTYEEQYTDESKEEDLQATAAKMDGEMKSTLAAVKRAVERK